MGQLRMDAPDAPPDFHRTLLTARLSDRAGAVPGDFPALDHYQVNPLKRIADNLRYTNWRNAGVEFAAGTGAGLAVWLWSIQQLKNSSSFSDVATDALMAIVLTPLVTSGTVWFTGRRLENRGSLKYTIFGAMAGGALTARIASLVAPERRHRDLGLGILFAGLPVGAVLGFNASFESPDAETWRP